MDRASTKHLGRISKVFMIFYLLFQKELSELSSKNYEGVSIVLVDDNIVNWDIFIKGPVSEVDQ